MSLHRVSVVSCDGCGWWEVTPEGRDVLEVTPRRPGVWVAWWSVLDEHQVVRVHLCPRCAVREDVAGAVRAAHPEAEGPGIP